MSNPVSIPCHNPKLCGVKAHRPGTDAKCMKTAKSGARPSDDTRTRLTKTPGVLTTKIGTEHASLRDMNPEFIKQNEDQRILMHDPRVIQIENELVDTPAPKSFMDSVRISSEEGENIKKAAKLWGFSEAEASDVVYSVQQIRRERLIADGDLDPRINILAGDRQVYEIAQELNMLHTEAHEAEAVERLKARFAELHVHEDDRDDLVEIVKHRVTIADTEGDGLTTVG